MTGNKQGIEAKPIFVDEIYAVNVTDKDAVDAVKRLVARLKKTGRPRPYFHFLTSAQFRAISNPDSFRRLS